LNFSQIKIDRKCTNELGLGLWCSTPLSTIFQLHRGGQFYWLMKPEYMEKTTDLSQVTDKLSLNVVSSTPRHERDSNSQHYFSSDRHWLHR